MGFRDLFRRRPQDAAGWQERAATALAAGAHDEALAAIEGALEAKPSSSELIELGRMLRDLDQLDRAVDVFGYARRLDARSAEACGHLGLTQLARGEVAAGLALLEEATALSPGVPEALVVLGRALVDHGRSAEAIPRLREAIALDERIQAAHALLGKALHQHESAAAAIPSLRRACQLDPEDLEARITLGVALAKAGQATEGIGIFEAALRQTSTPNALLVNLGLAFREAGDLKTAQRYFVDAVRLDPTFAAAQSNLGIALLEDGAAGAAAMTLRKAADLAPDWPTAHFNLGLALWRSGDLGGALDAIQRAAELAPGDDEIQAKLAELRGALSGRPPPRPPGKAPRETDLSLHELDEADLVPVIEAEVEQRTVPQASTPQNTSAAMMGTLDSFALPDLLEFLKNARRSGVLYLASVAGPGEVRLNRGSITAANSPRAPRLGDLLAAEKKISAEGLQRAASLQLARPQEPFGALLLELHLIRVEQLRELLVRQVKQAIRELMGWQDGTFAFEPAPRNTPTTDSEIQLDPSMILLDVLREQDEANADQNKGNPSDSSPFL